MDLVGKVLADRYEIREEIGKGGMAHVYKAWCNLLNRFVAIKVLKEEFRDDKEFVHRFNIEAQAAAGISNLHVVSIYDVGYQDGFYYIVMEYIEGVILKEYISQKGSLPWQEAVSIAAQICEGLSAAHKANVIHRDIKPQNIIKTPDGILKVTDFGIAKASSQATTTTGGQAIGTVHYISPEQARGGYTDQRTDIYSLGVVLYEMLTGKMPFVGESPVAVAIKHIQEKPMPLRRIKPDIPEMVERIVLKAMAKEQSARYASAEEFLKDLNMAMLGGGVAERDVVGHNTVEDDDMDSTIKMDGIDEKSIEAYESARAEKKRREERRVVSEREVRGVREVRTPKKTKEQKRKDRLTTWVAILTGLLVVIVLGYAFTVLTSGIKTSDEKVEIPNLVGMDLDAARRKYTGFNIVISEEKKSEKKVNTILEQSPKGKEKVFAAEDMVINVVVSAGKDSVEVSDYVNMKSEKAQAKAKKDGFQINIEERFSDSAEEGIVFAQEPVAGSVASEGALVTLYVSKGSGEEGEDDEEDDGDNTSSESPSSTQAPKPTSEPENTTNSADAVEPTKPTQPPVTTTPSSGGASESGTSSATGSVTAPGIAN